MVVGVGWRWRWDGGGGGNKARDTHPLCVVLVESASSLSSGLLGLSFLFYSCYFSLEEWYSYLRSQQDIYACGVEPFPGFCVGKSGVINH